MNNPSNFTLTSIAQPRGTRIILSVLITILAFPLIYPSYSTGLDCSAWYALNYFFYHNIQLGRDVLFTYGPLQFLEIPCAMGNIFQWSILFYFITLFTFSYTALSMGQLFNPGKWPLHVALLFILCQKLSVEDILPGITAISLIVFHEKAKWKWLLLACIACIAGLLVKASSGVMGIATIISYCIFIYLSQHNVKKVFFILGCLAFSYFMAWFAIYHNLSGSLRFLWATVQFSRDYTAALCLEADNNWWLLGGALICLALIPVLFKNSKFYLIYALFLFAIFSSWKHSYSRDDSTHQNVLFHFLFMFFFMVIIYVDKIKITQYLLMLATVCGLYLNNKSTGLYMPAEQITFDGFNNFCTDFFHYNGTLKKSIAESEADVSSKKLPDDVLKIIGNKTVDFFPTELGYIEANKLNWKPRPVIQSYISYNHWLDIQNANHFSSKKRPEFIIWQFSSDRWGDKNFAEIDDRNVLNNEPNTIYEILNHYSPIYKNHDFILLRKCYDTNLAAPKEIKTEIAGWNQWIKIPTTENGILRAKTDCKKNIAGLVKSALFRDEIFYIEYKLSNGAIVNYRFLPENAKDGIWVNPLFIRNIDDSIAHPYKVDSVRFICTNSALMSNDIKINWESIAVNDARMNQNVSSLFFMYKGESDNLVLHSTNGFEKDEEYWSGENVSVTDKEHYSGLRSEILKDSASKFAIFNAPIDSFITDSTFLTLSVTAWFKLAKKGKGSLVVQLFNDSATTMWKPFQLAPFEYKSDEWSQAWVEEKINPGHRKNVRLRVYLINDSSKELLIDNVDVKLYSHHVR